MSRTRRPGGRLRALLPGCLTLGVLLAPVGAPAHPGGMAADGCHNHRASGTCHCHGRVRAGPAARANTGKGGVGTAGSPAVKRLPALHERLPMPRTRRWSGRRPLPPNGSGSRPGTSTGCTGEPAVRCGAARRPGATRTIGRWPATPAPSTRTSSPSRRSTDPAPRPGSSRLATTRSIFRSATTRAMTTSTTDSRCARGGSTRS